MILAQSDSPAEVFNPIVDMSSLLSLMHRNEGSHALHRQMQRLRMGGGGDRKTVCRVGRTSQV